MPKVSIILTSFNHEKYIREAINSTLNQSFTDFELIIWDDASSDNSWYLISRYSDPRIKKFRNEIRKRVSWGINKAVSEVASGEYIAIHHSDDVWEPEKLAKQVAFLDAHPEFGAVFTNVTAIGEDSTPLKNEKHFYFSIFEQFNRTRFEWLNFFFNHGNALCHPSVLIRKSCYEDCGLYRFGFAQVTDFDMWIRLCLQYEIYVIPEKLVRFRVLENEANASGSRPETRIRGLYELYKLLPTYRKITHFDDLVKIFPSSAKFCRKKETDMDFALAMVALEEKPFTFTILFGLDILFEIISDPKRADSIKRLYGFDYKSFIELTAQHDVFSREEVATLSGQLVSLNQAVTERDGQITNLNQTLAEVEGLKAAQISHLEGIVREKEAALNNIYNSRGWKALAIYYRVRNKVFPINNKRRLFATLVFRTITSPKKTLRNLNKRNLKKFIYYFRTSAPEVLEEKIKSKILEKSKTVQTEQIKIGLQENITLEKIKDLNFPYYEQPLVTIIIPLWNKWQYTYNCLKSILKNTD